jgi:uridine kinase
MKVENTQNNQIQLSLSLIEKAASPNGFVASLDENDNYNRIWTRDAMMTSIAVLCQEKKSLYPAVKKSITSILSQIHDDGWVPSNISFGDKENSPIVSYGGPVGRIDNVFWLLIGGIYYMEISGDLSLKDPLQKLADKQLKITTSWEFNGKELMYCPTSSNWADEYPMEGYVLLNQILRYWAFKKVGRFYNNDLFTVKSNSIKHALTYHFFGEGQCKQPLFTEIQDQELSTLWGVHRIISSFSPSGINKRIDTLAYSLAIGLGIGTLETEERLIYLLNKASQGHLGLPCFYPIIKKGDKEYQELLSNYAYSFKNKAGHFHNGGIWPMVNGWALACLSLTKQKTTLYDHLSADFHRLRGEFPYFKNFSEYFDANNNEACGTKNLCFSAAGHLLSQASEKGLCQLFGRHIDVAEDVNNGDIVEHITDKITKSEKTPCILFISGESGSGKTTLAREISNFLKLAGKNSYVMSQDDYFLLPPNQNQSKRINDLSWVGINEVNLDLMKEHLSTLRQKNKSEITVPQLNRIFDRFDECNVEVDGFDFVIVEGTYVFSIATDEDMKVFLNISYKDTLKNRNSRNRDSIDQEISPKILEIEHRIIKEFCQQSDWIIDKTQTIITNSFPIKTH